MAKGSTPIFAENSKIARARIARDGDPSGPGRRSSRHAAGFRQGSTSSRTGASPTPLTATQAPTGPMRMFPLASVTSSALQIDECDRQSSLLSCNPEAVAHRTGAAERRDLVALRQACLIFSGDRNDGHTEFDARRRHPGTRDLPALLGTVSTRAIGLGQRTHGSSRRPSTRVARAAEIPAFPVYSRWLGD